MKKISAISRIIAFAVVLCLCAAFIPGMTFATETDGAANDAVSVYDGTVSEDLRHSADGSTYYIDSAADLAKFGAMVDAGNAFVGKTVYLTTDISWNENDSEYLSWATSAPANSWKPIGTYTNYFGGTFDGLGHTISGLYYAGSDNIFAGLFGYIGPASGVTVEIRNISVINSYFNGTRCGGIVSFIRGSGTVRVKNACVSAVMVGTSHAGGIVGGTWVDAGANTIEIENCIFEGSVSCASSLSKYNGHSGGIIGVVNATTNLKVSNCLNLGSVTGTNGTAGGIFGGFTRDDAVTAVSVPPTLTNNINLGTVSGRYAGEIYGSLQYTLSTANYASAENISNNVYDISKLISGDPFTGGMPEAEIKALGNDALATLGFTGWTSSTLNGTKVPLPTTVANMLAQENGAASLWDGATVDTNLRVSDDGNTYYIDTAAQLAGFAQNVNNGNTYAGKTVCLTTDIVWNENHADYMSWTAASASSLKNWTPIGNVYENNKRFRGTFDGLGHSIYGLYAYNTGNPGVGLFGQLDTGTIIIKNVSVVNSAFINTNANAATGSVVGQIFGAASVTIENVYSNALVSCTNSRAMGGIMGGAWNATNVTVTMNNVVFAGRVQGTATYGAGGMVGMLYRTTTLTNCLNLGSISSNGAVGGLFGSTRHDNASYTVNAAFLTISDSINLGSVQGLSGYTGHLYGRLVAPNITISTENIQNNLWSEGTAANLPMDVAAIRALTDTQLTELGFTAWTAGEEYPIPASVAAILDGSFAVYMVNDYLDRATVTNYFSKNDIPYPLFANSIITVTNPATVDAEGNLSVVVPLENETVERTMTIPKLPALSYVFNTEEKGIAEGTVTMIFDNYVADDYALYWGTADGLLDGYTALASANKLAVADNVLTYNVPDRVAIPAGATCLWLTVDGIRVCGYEIPAERRTALGAAKYSFGVVADTHFGYSAAPGNFTKAMNVFRAKGVEFVSIAGDFTANATVDQFGTFKATHAPYSEIPLFVAAGNHDALDWNIETGLISQTAAARLKENLETYANPDYTGPNGEFNVSVSPYYDGLYDYTVECEDDLFVYLGIGPNEIEAGVNNTDTYVYYTPSVTDLQLEWLDGVLANSEEYQNVFLVFHYSLAEAFKTEELQNSDALYEILKDHSNVVQFNGHMHWGFSSLDQLTTTCVLSKVNGDYQAASGPLGFTAVNVPSTVATCEGYVATVYESGTLLTGYNFSTGEAIPYATFFVANEAVESDDEIGSDGKDLSVNFTEITPAGKVYSLDMVWENSDFAFDYVAGEQGSWNPADHTYAETANAGWADDDLKVTVVNHSNQGVKVTMEIADGDAADNLTVTSDKATEILATAEDTTVENAPKVEYNLTITGTPTESVTKVATATLIFAAAE